MATGDKQVNIFVDRLLSKTALKEQLLEYLSSKLDEVLVAIMQGTSGTLDSDKIGILADGNDRIKLDLSLANRVVIGGSGQVITIPADVADATKEVDFENEVGVIYEVGMAYAQIPSDPDITSNRQGTPVYAAWEDSFGEVDYPSVTPAPLDTYGVSLRLYIDTITEAGVDHSGRTVKVWLVEPVSSVESVAFFEGTSEYDGTNNYIDIPYSGADGPCGQDTSADPPSETPTDYRVFIKGCSIKRNTSMRNSADYAFIGTVIGDGAGTTPTLFDTDDQIAVFFQSLDKAYDSIGSGAGRAITLDSGAVELRSGSSGSGDIMRGQLRLTRDGSTENMGFMLQYIMENEKSIPVAALEPLDDGTKLTESEPVTISSATITFTGSTVDLQDVNLRLNPKIQILLLETASVQSEVGVYLIDSVSAAKVLTIKDLDGSTPILSSTSGTVTILHPAFVFSNDAPNPLVGSGQLDFWNGFLFSLRTGEKNDRMFNILPEKGGKFIFWDSGKSTPSSYPTDIQPREMLEIDPDVIGTNLKWPFIFRRSVLINGGIATGASGEESGYNRDGMRVTNAGGGFDSRNPCFPFVYDVSNPEQAATYGTSPAVAVDAAGGLCRGHHFRDDFIGYSVPTIWTNSYPQPPCYTTNFVGSGQIKPFDIYSGGAEYGHGALHIETGSSSSDSAELILASYPFNLDTGKDFRWTFRGRLKILTALTNTSVQFGFLYSSTSNIYYFEYVSGTGWTFKYYNGTSLQTGSETCGAAVSEYQWFEISLFPTAVSYTIENKKHGANSFLSGSETIASLDGQAGGMSMACKVLTNTAAARTVVLDYWEVFDREILYARMGTSHNLNHGS